MGGCSARKSPPFTESTKWISGESPSPLVFTAPLMPPCAHTECERRQGTNENTSHSCPASQILMTVMRPARPPPTTMNLGFSAVAIFPSGRHLVKSHQRRIRDRQERRADQAAHQTRPALRARADGQPPMDAGVPQAVGEVVDGAGHADEIDPQHLD